jgi:hypothetical protein
MMLSSRTVNGSVDATSAYARQLVAYAAALGAPRVMIDELSFGGSLLRCLVREVPNNLQWTEAKMQCPPECEALREKYQDNYALGYDRYKQASTTKTIKCPAIESLAEQVSAMAPSMDVKGRIGLSRPGDKMQRELNALCMVYLDEELARLAGNPEGTLLAS